LKHGRYRYEETDEYVHLIAQDFGVSRSRLYDLATQWGWRKRSDRPPRPLPVEQRLLMEASDAAAKPPNVPVASSPAPEAEAPPAPDTGNVVERLQRAVEKELAAVELMRAQYGPLPQPPLDAERTARTLQTLTETLFKVQNLRASEKSTTGPDDYDDLPRDPDEFRRELARRIRVFVRSRRDRAIPPAGESPGGGTPP
jgi:hypothetical protein